MEVLKFLLNTRSWFRWAWIIPCAGELLSNHERQLVLPIQQGYNTSCDTLCVDGRTMGRGLVPSMRTPVNSLDQVQLSRGASKHRLIRANYVGQNFPATLHADFAGPIGKRHHQLGIFIAQTIYYNKWSKRTCKYLQRTIKDSAELCWYKELRQS